MCAARMAAALTLVAIIVGHSCPAGASELQASTLAAAYATSGPAMSTSCQL